MTIQLPPISFDPSELLEHSGFGRKYASIDLPFDSSFHLDEEKRTFATIIRGKHIAMESEHCMGIGTRWRDIGYMDAFTARSEHQLLHTVWAHYAIGQPSMVILDASKAKFLPYHDIIWEEASVVGVQKFVVSGNMPRSIWALGPRTVESIVRSFKECRHEILGTTDPEKQGTA